MTTTPETKAEGRKEAQASDTQARELVQSMRDAALIAEHHLRDFLTHLDPDDDGTANVEAAARSLELAAARANTYLATPAGSTERPSDAAIRRADRLVDDVIRTELDASRTPAKEECPLTLNVNEAVARLLCGLPAIAETERGIKRTFDPVAADRELTRMCFAPCPRCGNMPPAKEAGAAGDAPVAWRWVHPSHGGVIYQDSKPFGSMPVEPLYTRPAPPAVAVGVSEEDLDNIARKALADEYRATRDHSYADAILRGRVSGLHAIGAIKRALRESFANRRAAQGERHE